MNTSSFLEDNRNLLADSLKASRWDRRLVNHELLLDEVEDYLKDYGLDPFYRRQSPWSKGADFIGLNGAPDIDGKAHKRYEDRYYPKIIHDQYESKSTDRRSVIFYGPDLPERWENKLRGLGHEVVGIRDRLGGEFDEDIKKFKLLMALASKALGTFKERVQSLLPFGRFTYRLVTDIRQVLYSKDMVLDHGRSGIHQLEKTKDQESNKESNNKRSVMTSKVKESIIRLTTCSLFGYYPMKRRNPSLDFEKHGETLEKRSRRSRQVLEKMRINLLEPFRTLLLYRTVKVNKRQFLLGYCPNKTPTPANHPDG